MIFYSRNIQFDCYTFVSADRNNLKECFPTKFDRMIPIEIWNWNIFIHLGKVHIFWEGHKILRKLQQLFDRQYIGQIIGGDFAKFGGLLRIYELYFFTFLEIKRRKIERKFWILNGLRFSPCHLTRILVFFEPIRVVELCKEGCD